MLNAPKVMKNGAAKEDKVDKAAELCNKPPWLQVLLATCGAKFTDDLGEDIDASLSMSGGEKKTPEWTNKCTQQSAPKFNGQVVDEGQEYETDLHCCWQTLASSGSPPTAFLHWLRTKGKQQFTQNRRLCIGILNNDNGMRRGEVWWLIG